MSLILDALKKTQSALNPHRDTARATPPKKEQHSQQHIPFSFQKNKTIDFTRFLNRWTIGICSAGLLIAILLVGHHFFSTVFKRYMGFYGELASAVSNRSPLITPANKPIVSTQKPTLVELPAIPNFQLQGTVQVNGEHLALINQVMYHPGQFIGDFEITQVRYENVTLFNRKTHQIVRLVPPLTS